MTIDGVQGARESEVRGAEARGEPERAAGKKTRTAGLGRDPGRATVHARSLRDAVHAATAVKARIDAGADDARAEWTQCLLRVEAMARLLSHLDPAHPMFAEFAVDVVSEELADAICAGERDPVDPGAAAGGGDDEPAAADPAAASAPLQRQAPGTHGGRGGHGDPFGMHLIATPVQRSADGDATTDVHAAAARGVAGPAERLPFHDRIQAGFGPAHDVSHVQAHVGGAATEAAAAMGASAYATGDQIAFAGSPDLHTAAHEAAHVVQQRAGVQLKGGVGETGDPYERHADAVADAVVAGASAAPILDQMAGGGGSSRAVQRELADWQMVPPEVVFPGASFTRQRELLRAERDVEARAGLLRSIAPERVLQLLTDQDPGGLKPHDVLAVLDLLPRVVAAADASTASDILTLRPDAPANRRLFLKLKLAVQIEAFSRMSTFTRAELFPGGREFELQTALLNRLEEGGLRELMKGLTADQVQDLVDYMPPHVVGRIRAACQSAGVHQQVVGLAPSTAPAAGRAGAASADGAPAAIDEDAYADQLQVDGEAWTAQNDQPKKSQRKTSADAPEPDEWVAMPRQIREAFFQTAFMGKRLAYLQADLAGRQRMLQSLDDKQDRAETVAAYVRKHPWPAQKLLEELDENDLLALLRATPDPHDVATLFRSAAQVEKRSSLLLSVMTPNEIASVFTSCKNEELRTVWESVVHNVAPAMVTSVLRRLSPEELERLESWSNDHERVQQLTPPERRPAPATGT